MTQQVHRRHSTDTRTVLSVTLKQPNESGVDTVVDLTGLTVKFRMINRANGTTTIAETATGVTIETAASGTVKYDFASAGVLTAGEYNGFFVVYDGSETDTIPVKRDDLRIKIDSDLLTAEQAYDAALADA